MFRYKTEKNGGIKAPFCVAGKGGVCAWKNYSLPRLILWGAAWYTKAREDRKDDSLHRKFTEKDRAQYLAMSREFYQGDGVSHAVPEENFNKTFTQILRKNPYLEGWMIEAQGHAAGYILLSFTYGNEAGGMIVLLEELYIRPEYQGQGLGTQALTFVKEQYRGKAVEIQLEVMPQNKGAIRLYRKHGYESIVYQEMCLQLAGQM
jgi:acetyltransferase, GNAT family